MLGKRLVTMKLTGFPPEAIVEEILDNKESLVSAMMFLLSLATKRMTLEVWQKSLLEEQQDGI